VSTVDALADYLLPVKSNQSVRAGISLSNVEILVLTVPSLARLGFESGRAADNPGD
jgi:hypothetical protein